MKIPTIEIYGDRAWISFESFPSLTEIENVQMVQFWLSWFRLAVSSEQKVPLVMFANIVCSSVSRNAGLGGGVAGVGGKRSLLGNSLAGVLVELRTARRHTSHTHCTGPLAILRRRRRVFQYSLFAHSAWVCMGTPHHTRVIRYPRLD